jgi:hypothetical protein
MKKKEEYLYNLIDFFVINEVKTQSNLNFMHLMRCKTISITSESNKLKKYFQMSYQEHEGPGEKHVQYQSTNRFFALIL